MNLTKLSYPLGWTPNADSVNGDPNGLLRMDNLQQDETGALTLVKGIRKLGNPLEDFIYKTHSRWIAGKETIWTGLNNVGRAIVRTNNDFGSVTTVLEDGGGLPTFGDCLGQTLCISGNKRKKDDGTNIYDLGLKTPPDPPKTTNNSQNTVSLQNQCELVEGHDFRDGVFTYVDSTTLRGVLEATQWNGNFDTVNFGGSTNRNYPTDAFQWLWQFKDTSGFVKIRIEFILDDSGSNAFGNLYWWEATLDSGIFNLGLDIQTKITVPRSAFTRQGLDTTLDWTTVKKIRYTAIATADLWFLVDEGQVVGGAKGSLNGAYEYLCINVSDTGVYVAKSGVSPISDPVNVINGFIDVQGGGQEAGGSQPLTGTWYFRRSFIGSVPSDTPVNLPDFYLVGQVAPGASFTDNVSDNDALTLNVKANRFLQSLNDLSDYILGIEGIYNERMLYLSPTSLYLSDRLNPEAIDQRYTLRVSGDPLEKNLWVKKISNNTLILATTKDLYPIIGTLLDLPDGSLDAVIAPIGEAYPPLSDDFGFVDGNIFYTAADGIRYTAGSNSVKISNTLDLLFQGYTRHGVPGIAISAENTSIYSLAVGHNKLFCVLPTLDGSRRLFIYDFTKQIWTLRFTDPVTVFVTPTERVLLGYGGGDGNFVRQLDIGNDIDGTGQGLPFTYLTVFDANGQPRNRKDTFTLKWVGDTGGATVQIDIAKDGGAFTNLGSFSQNGEGTQYFKLSGVTLGFRYALRITAEEVNTYKQYEVTIEYDPRPEQVNYMRIPSTNLGTISRKQFISYAFVVDTLGADVTFTPLIDGAAVSTATPPTVNTNGKLTYIDYFNDSQIGVDIGGILESTNPEHPFEFYAVNLDECVSEKLPASAKFLVIPANNYGVPNRKRYTSYKFQILTRGLPVQFTPRVDGVDYAAANYITNEKRVVEYFFDTDLDVKGIDIGGTIKTLADTAFEFYGPIIPQKVEQLPDRLKSLYIPYDNLGSATRKRVRTLPIVIDTYGSPVIYTPMVDGAVVGSPTTLTSSRKQTLYHYFIVDMFGIDFGGTLIGDEPFEFYSFGNPEEVEVLPVPKKFDQLQPMRWDRIGKLFAFRTRLVMTGTTTAMPFKIYGDDVFESGSPLISGTFPVIPNTDNVYHVDMPKSINSTIMRIVLGPTTDPFHRYDLLAKVATSGMESTSKWISVR